MGHDRVPVGLFGFEATDVTGTTVVEMIAVDVTTAVESAGQLVIVGAQLTMVTVRVV
jgi:hypothetical protein